MTTKAKTETAPAAKTESGDAPALTFREADVPAIERSTKPNPFAETVKTLAENKGSKAVSFDAKDAAAAKSLVALAQKAGKAHGVSVRNKRQENKDGTVTVTIWAVERITRNRSDESPASA